ncbi:MAG: hypothetical protein Q4A78_03650 [Peptostreptococcaceae bacterium]|nr:hypothetical protein [Peptostreptococcaceae bacterium]
MHRLLFFVIFLFFILLTSGCSKIATPDELLEQPALNIEHRSIKDAVDQFLPEGSSLITISKNEKVLQDSFSKIDLDSDGIFEFIFFYKENKSKFIQAILLQEKGENWHKLCDIPLDAGDILRYQVEDLNNDMQKEIIIGAYVSNISELSIFSFQDQQLRKIVQTPYESMDIADMDNDMSFEIAVLFREDDFSESRIRLFNIENQKSILLDEIIFEEFKEAYYIRIGRIYDDTKAIFVDSYTQIHSGYTDIFFLEQKKLRSYEEKFNQKLKDKYYLIRSSDVDEDGFCEIGYPYAPPDDLEIDYEKMNGDYAVSYYKIKKDGSVHFAKQIYYNESIGLIFNVPQNFIYKYDIKRLDQDTRLICNYYTPSKESWPLFEIFLMEKEAAKEDQDELQLLGETQNQLVMGRVFDYSKDLEDPEKLNYLEMRTQILDLSKYIDLSGID